MQNSKKRYEAALIEVMLLSCEDIIRTSAETTMTETTTATTTTTTEAVTTAPIVTTGPILPWDPVE